MTRRFLPLVAAGGAGRLCSPWRRRRKRKAGARSRPRPRPRARPFKAGPFTRLPDGKPDLQGIWTAGNFAAADDVEDHLVDRFQIRAGKGIIVDPPGGKIPYQQWALDEKEGPV